MLNTTSVYYEVTCKICTKVRDAFKTIFDSMVEARQMQAYYTLATHMQHQYPNKSIVEIIQILKEGK
jgi:hypothetical protein